MKRSKMLKILKKELESWQDCELTMKTAEAILDLLEDNGMLPPMTYCELDGYTQYFEWEEENE